MPKPEDRKLTPKENYLRILNGQMPEWAPVYTMGAPLPNGDDMPLAWATPSVLNDPHARGGGKDLWGVNWVGNYENGGAVMPEPNNFILKDIEDWHDVVKAPDISDVDWETVAKQTLKNCPVNREKTAIGLDLYIGTFQEYVGMMGFTEGLIAMIEEPEEAAELCKYINDFYVEVGRNIIPYLKPDVIMMADDTCSASAPFMSEELFRQVLLPCYQHTTETLAVANDLPVEFHNCGTAVNFMEILHEEANVNAWDPAQTMNDLDAFKAKWGREFPLVGGYDIVGELMDPECPDELIVESVRECFDRLAPDGGFAFLGMFIGPVDDPRIGHKNMVLWNEACDYGNTFYD